MSPAAAVLPPSYYDRAVQASAVKAVARVIAVEDISVSSRFTRKQVTFSLIRAFEPGIPDQFQGECYAVDKEGQNPGVGGQLYFYPVKGLDVLVTISSNTGSITSFTPMNRTLDRLTALGGLSQVCFVMGKAFPEKETEWNWYLFELDDQPAGYLAVNEEAAPEDGLSRTFKTNFLVRLSGEDRQLFRIRSRARDDNRLSLQWLGIQPVRISDREIIPGPVREIGFKPDQTGISSGILVHDMKNTFDVPLPGHTTSDFLLFPLASSFEPVRQFSMELNLVETLELHLKTGRHIVYKEMDPSKEGAHHFVLEPGPYAQYWTDDGGNLTEVVWDSDKRFIRMPREKILEILTP